MSKIRMTPWLGLGLALSAALVTGCVAAPSVLRTSLPNVVGETYGDNTNPPEFVKAIPVGEEVAIPRGKAAMTLFVVIPQKQAAQEGERSAQYIEFGNIRRVDVTITGENLINPVTTTINVSSGTSAAGTVVLNAGRNQIIKAVGKDASGNIVSTVKGVSTSLAGQVVNAEAKFGTTPLAAVIGGLSTEVAPVVNMAAISGVINPILSPVNNNGSVTYSTHPTFVNPTPVINAINALVSGGTQPGAITTGMIMDQLGGAQPIYPASTVTLQLRDPQGNAFILPSQGVRYVYPVDRNGDGQVDGTTFGSDTYGASMYSIRLSDPVSYDGYSIGAGQSQTAITNVPPGTFQVTYFSERASMKPWEVWPFHKSATVSVTPGSSQSVDLQLVDVSQPVSVSATGSFSNSGEYSQQIGYQSCEWFRFPTSANLVYRVSYDASQVQSYYSGNKLMVFDRSGAQLFQSESATDSYTFASAAANSIYVYTPFSNTAVEVTTESLGANQSLYNTTIRYGE